MTLRIGIPLIGSPAWHGGITYIEAVLRAFRALPRDEQPELWLLVDVQHEKTLTLHEYLFPLISGVISCGAGLDFPVIDGRPCIAIENFEDIVKCVDFIFPVNSECLPGFAHASWIPDLQHKHLPKFFTAVDHAARDHSIDQLASVADIVVFSSGSAKRDFQNFYTDFDGRIEVVPFYSRFDEQVFSLDPAEYASKYDLPDRYMICCNQFWQHKNHDNLFKGMARTKRPMHIVFTGGQSDYRNEDWFPYLKNLIADMNIESRVTLLGFIPREDQIQLIRQSVGVVQPSFYEGWSTVLEDARGLGKSVLASNIDVHLEQAVPGAVYFDPKSPDEIAAALDALDALPNIGIDRAAEHKAQQSVCILQIEAARLLLQIGKDCIEARDASQQSAAGAKVLRALRYGTVQAIALNADLYKKEELIESNIPMLKREVSEMQKVLIEKEVLIEQMRVNLKDLPLWGIPMRVINILRPRLGNLHQYTARILTPPSEYIPKTAATPLVSIVTPSYGQASFIERTIRSVLGQQYPNLEYFVQDGGSKDGTPAILARYEDRLTGWESKPDSGQSQAINLGFAKMRGEIMGWLNSDDVLLPGALACVVDYFNTHPHVDVVYGDRLLIDESDMEIGRWIMPPHDSKVLAWVDYIPQEALFWRRSIWDKAGGQIDESFKFAMDWDLLVRFQVAGAKFAHIKRFIGAFRIHEHQKTSAAINEIGFQEMNRIRERVLGRIPERKEIRNAVLSFMLKHLAVDMSYRIKTRLGVKR